MNIRDIHTYLGHIHNPWDTAAGEWVLFSCWWFSVLCKTRWWTCLPLQSVVVGEYATLLHHDDDLPSPSPAACRRWYTVTAGPSSFSSITVLVHWCLSSWKNMALTWSSYLLLFLLLLLLLLIVHSPSSSAADHLYDFVFELVLLFLCFSEHMWWWSKFCSRFCLRHDFAQYELSSLEFDPLEEEQSDEVRPLESVTHYFFKPFLHQCCFKSFLYHLLRQVFTDVSIWQWSIQDLLHHLLFHLHLHFLKHPSCGCIELDLAFLPCTSSSSPRPSAPEIPQAPTMCLHCIGSSQRHLKKMLTRILQHNWQAARVCSHFLLSVLMCFWMCVKVPSSLENQSMVYSNFQDMREWLRSMTTWCNLQILRCLPGLSHDKVLQIWGSFWFRHIL